MSNRLMKRKPISPEIKTHGLKTTPQKQTLRSLQLGKNIKLNESRLDREQDMPSKSKTIQNKSSDSDKLSEEDLMRKRTSRLRTMKLQPVTDKKVLMNKFECSLKERLLNSAHFSTQVPLYDSISKDKIRMKTPSLDEEDLCKNESMFNAVFPVRKETGKGLSPQLNENIFSNYTKESQDWLSEIEKQVRKEEAKEDKPPSVSDEGLLKKSTKLIKPPKKGLGGSKHQGKTIQNEIDNTSEQSEVPSSQRLPSKIRSRGSNRSAIVNENISIPELDASKSQILILPKSAKKTDSDSKKSLIVENQKSVNRLETDNSNPSEMFLKLDKSNAKQSDDQTSENMDHQIKTIYSKKLPDEKLNEDSNISSNYNMDIVIVEKDISDKDSVHIYGQGRTDEKRQRQQSSFKGSSQSTSLTTNQSLSISNKGLRQGGALGGKDSLMHFDEYNVLYFQVDESSMAKKDDTSGDTSAETAETSPGTIPSAQSQLVVESENKILDVRSEISDDEELQKEAQDEEDCTVEPCNEPGWFEEYGIDRKNRKGMESEVVKSEESLEDVIGELVVIEEVGTAKEVEREDVQESKKKKVKKTQVTDFKEFEESLEIMEEIQEFQSEVLREIKTVPLVAIDDIPMKDRLMMTTEKPKSKMPAAYLKKYVGKHLVAGLAQVALLMPKDPIDYLAHWLIKERNKENLLEDLKEFKSEVRQIRKQNIGEMRRKLQIDYLQNEAIKRYNEAKYEPIYPAFDSSELKQKKHRKQNK